MNCHKLRDLRHEFIFSEVRRFEVKRGSHWAKTKVAGRHQPLETLAEDPFPCPFQLLETSLVRGPSLHLQRGKPSIFQHLSNPDPPAFPFIRTLVTTLDSTPLPDNP